MRVDTCLCSGWTFARLRERLQAGGSLEELMRCTGAGMGCGLCRPYLREMARTGETVFRRLLPPEPGDPGAGA
ncbi:MAG: (2Fe-2S)-binding protein [Candidatus Eisenbacteria bacterium]|nr:(2Fe-2S)-binding protein [Candidatus Eisenbacteria bacterium]